MLVLGRQRYSNTSSTATFKAQIHDHPRFTDADEVKVNSLLDVGSSTELKTHSLEKTFEVVLHFSDIMGDETDDSIEALCYCTCLAFLALNQIVYFVILLSEFMPVG